MLLHFLHENQEDKPVSCNVNVINVVILPFKNMLCSSKYSKAIRLLS